MPLGKYYLRSKRKIFMNNPGRYIKVITGYLSILLIIAGFFIAPSVWGGYRDGSYLGVVRQGIFLVKLNVIIADGRIQDIEYLEIPDWMTKEVKKIMRREIVKQQSLEVDAITGATISCDLIKEAARKALDQAREKADPPPYPSPGDSDSRVVLETNRGDITLRLFPEQAPRAVDNFLGLVRKGYYNGTVFHRVIPNFMIQGGDPTGTGRGGRSLWGKPFPDEFSPSLRFDRVGLLAMANSGPGTNGSQFFITLAKTPWLNDHHTIFGEVISGQEVVQAIERSPRSASDHPLQDQKIIKARILKGPGQQ